MPTFGLYKKLTLMILTPTTKSQYHHDHSNHGRKTITKQKQHPGCDLTYQ